MLTTKPFYHASSRKIVASFGTMFNNIMIDRTDSNGGVVKRIKIPIAYASAQHYIKKINSKSNSDISIDIVLPRISFVLDNLVYNPMRQLNVMGYKKHNDPEVIDGLLKRWNPVPYDFYFTLTIYAKNMDDGLQIIEQIVPYFAPEVTMPIKMVDDVVFDVPVSLENVTFQDNDLDGFDANRLMQWDISFNAKGIFFKPITSGAGITSGTIGYGSLEDFESDEFEYGEIVFP